METLYVVQRSKMSTVKYTVPKDLKDREIDVNLLDKTYIIGLINMTANTCFTIAATRRIGGSDAEWKWTPIPKTCPNCRSDYQTCASQGRYSPIMSTDCTSAPFEIFVGHMVDDNTAQGAQFDITPKCQYPGGLIGITD